MSSWMMARATTAADVSISRSKSLAAASFEQRRQLVLLLIDRVIVTDAEVEIRYVLPTSPESEHVRFCHLRKDYFDYPTAREQVEACGLARPLDDLEPQPFASGSAGGDLALIASIGEQVLEPGIGLANSGADQPQAIAVLDAGGVDDQPQRQSQRVGEQMPLATVDFLAGIIAARAAGFGRLDALAVDDRGRGLRLAPGLLAGGHQQRGPDGRPDAISPEGGCVGVSAAVYAKPPLTPGTLRA